MAEAAFPRTPAAQPSPGIAVGEGHYYADGFRPGDIKYAYGVLAQLLARNPGWLLADGTVVLEDGTTPPDLRDRFIVGAGTTYALGATGGSASLAAHGHGFTQPTAHGNHAHDNNHSVTQPTAHTITQPVLNNHLATLGAVEVAPLGGSAVWVIANNSAANAALSIQHSLATLVGLTPNHAGSAVTGHSDHSHDNNHSGGAVTNNAGGGSALPPYAALYALIKVH